MVVDEAHKLKNRKSRTTTVLSGLCRSMSVLLTGTPIQNNLEELLTLVQFVHPQAFPDSRIEAILRDFLAQTGQSQVVEMREHIRPYLLRRTKADVDLKLPPKEETIIEVELTAVQKRY